MRGKREKQSASNIKREGEKEEETERQREGMSVFFLLCEYFIVSGWDRERKREVDSERGRKR